MTTFGHLYYVLGIGKRKSSSINFILSYETAGSFLKTSKAFVVEVVDFRGKIMNYLLEKRIYCVTSLREAGAILRLFENSPRVMLHRE